MEIILIILTILALNLSVIFFIKSRINMIILITTSNLITILLYSLTIDNFLILKELAIVTIIYSIIIAFLIVSHKEKQGKIRKSKPDLISFSVLTLICAVCTIYLSANINKDLIAKKEAKINNQIINLQDFEQNPTNNKIEYLRGQDINNSVLFNHFGDFLIIISAIIIFLFLTIKEEKE